ncbi:MAG: hypothetical protein Q9187_002096 [Circinaria calcarea]
MSGLALQQHLGLSLPGGPVLISAPNLVLVQTLNLALVPAPFWAQVHSKMQMVKVRMESLTFLSRTRGIESNVIIKTASKYLRARETHYLTLLRDCKDEERRKQRHIRQMVDSIADPPSMVLEYMEDDLWNLCGRRCFQRAEIKTIARQLLSALSLAHSKNVVHTDLMPANVLLSGVTEDGSDHRDIIVKLADFATASAPSNHEITPSSFRAPEVWLELPWDTKADIWSFGSIIAMLMKGVGGELHGSYGKKDTVTADMEKLRAQNQVMGRYPAELRSRASQKWQSKLEEFDQLDQKNFPCIWPISCMLREITLEDSQFIERVMKHIPEERPSADELLMDPWFDEPSGEYIQDLDARRKAGIKRGVVLTRDSNGNIEIDITDGSEAPGDTDRDVNQPTDGSGPPKDTDHDVNQPIQ